MMYSVLVLSGIISEKKFWFNNKQIASIKPVRSF